MSTNETLTHKAFCSQKVNAVHSLTHYVRDTPVIRYVQQMSVVLFPVGSKLPPFLYVLTVFLQMEAHDVLHKT